MAKYSMIKKLFLLIGILIYIVIEETYDLKFMIVLKMKILHFLNYHRLTSSLF